jgi:hypothetical protein
MKQHIVKILAIVLFGGIIAFPAANVLATSPPSYQNVEGDYRGKVGIAVYNLDNTVAYFDRYLDITITTQSSDTISAAMITLGLTAVDAHPIQISATGFVGSGNIPRFTLMGLEGTGGDTVMAIGKMYPNRAKTAPIRIQGVIYGIAPSTGTGINDMKFSGSFTLSINTSP